MKSGEVDMSIQHGACPVLYGSKWIANKWIHELFRLVADDGRPLLMYSPFHCSICVPYVKSKLCLQLHFVGNLI
ncbi:unnamed protein product [Soboliphyme baturini]|uniref:Ovule protein n=1 Tax=Soboliphyme baturini TaxID=241478 RepID=A0A183IN69_9BILA|nr:unnamed protein product [Soboliphyme baturini]